MTAPATHASPTETTRPAEGTVTATPDGAAIGATASPSLASALAEVISVLSASRRARPLVIVAISTLVVIIVSTYGQLRVIQWYKPFIDAASRRDLHDYFMQLGVFGALAFIMIILNVSQGWLAEMMKVITRDALVRDLISHWMQPGRASVLSHAGLGAVTSVQHIHVDARQLTEFSVDLGVGLLQASIVTACFTGLLWSFGDLTAPLAGHEIVIRGYLVWTALLYSILASLLSYWVGRSLISGSAELSAREADLNHSLVRVHDHIDPISFAAGEAIEAERLESALGLVLSTMRRVVYSLTNLTWVTMGYGWLGRIAPSVVAAAPYFSGKVSFGAFMAASFALMQVQASLRWFVDNFPTIARWRGSLDRVVSFRRSMMLMDSMGQVGRRIAIIDGDAGKLIVKDLVISAPSGTTELTEKHVEIVAGERLLIIDDEPAARDAPLFRVLAGLWLWGRGEIVRPRGEPIMYIPRTAYLPSGTLREVLAYPSPVAQFEAAASSDAALARLGMDHLIPLLDSTRRWEHALNEGERHCVIFARVVLRRPRWLMIDHVFDSLDQRLLDGILTVLATDLPQTGVVYVGRKGFSLPWFTRVLHMRTTLVRPRVLEKATGVRTEEAPDNQHQE